MITIEKGNHKIICTKLAYEYQYKPLGYQIASEKKRGAVEEKQPLSLKEKTEKTEKKVEKEIEVINDDKEEKEEIKAKYGLKKKKK